MAGYNDLVESLIWLLTHRIQQKIAYQHGLLGNGSGQVRVSDLPDFVYVRPDRYSDRAFKIFNRRVEGQDGDPVIFGELPWQPGLIQVIDLDWETYKEAGGWGDYASNVFYHGQTHEWQDGAPGIDTFNVYRRQLGDLKVTPSPSGTVAVEVSPYSMELYGEQKQFPGIVHFPIQGAVPSATGTACLALIYWGPASGTTGYLGVATGTLGLDASPFYLDHPVSPPGTVPTAFVRLAGGMTSIRETDIFDAREPFRPGIAFGTGSSQLHAGLIPIADSGAYYTGTTVETALQEVGAELDTVGSPYKLVSPDGLIDPVLSADNSGDVTAVGHIILSGASKAVKGIGSNTPDLGTSTAAERIGNLYLADTKTIDNPGTLNINATTAQIFKIATAEVMQLSATALVINDGGLDRDVRVEGVGEANLWVVDAGAVGVSIGSATFLTGAFGVARFQIDRAANGSLLLHRETADTGASTLEFLKRRAGWGVVSDGDRAGTIGFSVADGVDAANMVQIYAEADGTQGLNDAPGRLLFATALDGTATPIERVRIDNAGNVSIGGFAPTLGMVHIKGAGNTTLAVQSPDANQAELMLRRTTSDYGWSIYKPASTLDLRFFESNVPGGDRVTFQAGGRVGIGTSVPQKLLQVGVGTDVPVLTTEGIYIAVNGAAALTVRDNTNDVEAMLLAWNTGIVYAGAVTNHPFVLRTNNIDRVTVAATGLTTIDANSNTAALRLLGADGANEIVDLFVGSTGNFVIDLTPGSDTFQFLDVRTESNDYSLVLRRGDTGAASSPFANFYVVDDTVDYLNICISQTRSTVGLTLNASQYVGIGVNASVPMHINKATGEQIRLADTSATGSPYLSFYQTTTRRSFIQHRDSLPANDTLTIASEYGPMTFEVAATPGSQSATEYMRLFTGGQGLGIGPIPGNPRGFGIELYSPTGPTTLIPKVLTAIDGTPQTVVANGTGDASRGCAFLYVCYDSGGNDDAGIGFLTQDASPGPTFVINTVALNSVTLTLAADGSITVVRSQGSRTFTLLLWLLFG